MPTYDYQCDACGHVFSAQQRFSDPPLEACPKCGARPRKLLSRPAIVFKGSGWHVTDYRSKDGASGGSDGAAKSDAAAKDAPAPDAAKAKDSSKKENPSAKPDSSTS